MRIVEEYTPARKKARGKIRRILEQATEQYVGQEIEAARPMFLKAYWRIRALTFGERFLEGGPESRYMKRQRHSGTRLRWIV